MVARSTPLVSRSPWRFTGSGALVPAKPVSIMHSEPIRHDIEIRPSKALSFRERLHEAQPIRLSFCRGFLFLVKFRRLIRLSLLSLADTRFHAFWLTRPGWGRNPPSFRPARPRLAAGAFLQFVPRLPFVVHSHSHFPPNTLSCSLSPPSLLFSLLCFSLS